MPEFFAVVLVFMVAVGVLIGARIYARNPVNHNATRELERLRGHESWLRQRLQTAQRERWSSDMIARITADLEVTAQELKKAAPPARQS